MLGAAPIFGQGTGTGAQGRHGGHDDGEPTQLWSLRAYPKSLGRGVGGNYEGAGPTYSS